MSLPLPSLPLLPRDIVRCSYFLVIGLEDPLRHGSQRHAHLVLQLERKPVTVPLNIPDEDVRAGRYEGLGKDSQTSEGELPRVLASLLKHISGKPIFKPGNFGGAAGPATKAVRCSCKSNDGLLYPLEKSMLFVHKPTLWLRYADISSLEFRRSGVGRGTWEMAVNVKSGVATGVAGELLFQSLDKGEWEPLRSYLTERGVTITESAFGGGALPSRGYAEAGSDDDDEDGGDEDGGKRKRGGDDDDEDSSDDESYHGEGDDDDDDDDDDDGGGSGSSSEDEDEGFTKKKGKGKKSAAAGKEKGKGKASKKPKAKRARKDDDDDDDDE